MDQPRVDESERASVVGHEGGIWHAILRFGYSETPDVPKTMGVLPISGFVNDPMKVTFFLGRETIVIGSRNGMAKWRKRLFAFLFGNAVSPTAFFRLPPDRVVEIGSQTVL